MKKSIILYLLIPLLALMIASIATAQIRYVKVNAEGNRTGASWQDAFTELQLAIDVSSDGDTICVAAGNYFPLTRIGGDSLRNATFYIQKDVQLFGGFEGTPGSEGDFGSRDVQQFVTTLSGDVGILNDTADNAFHVVYIDHVSDTMRLDGFTIRGGNGFGGAGFEATGCGIFINAEAGRAHPQIWNCIIRDNSAPESGAGVFNYAASGGIIHPVFAQCEFVRNAGSGGGAYGSYTDTQGEEKAVFISCRFAGNTARTAQGAAVSQITHSSENTSSFYNCIFTGNHSPSSTAFNSFVTGTGMVTVSFVNSAFAGNANGAISVTDLGLGSSLCSIRNSVLWDNGNGSGVTVNGAVVDASHSIIPFGFPGENMLGIDPLFTLAPTDEGTPHELGDLHAQIGSPMVDAGRNTDVPAFITSDADGLPRFVNPSLGGMPPGIVDIGPYELQELQVSTSSPDSFGAWTLYPNPAADLLHVILPSDGRVTEMRLYNACGTLVGRRVYGHGETHDEMYIGHLPAGTYKVVLHQDQIVEAKMIIKP